MDTINSEDILTLKPPPADQRVSYGSDPLHFIDVRLPKKNASRRAAMFIHGGYWRAKYDLVHAGHICADLAQRGWLSLNVEYRRVGNPGGGWPGTFSDLRRAYDFIRSSARKWNIDADKISVLGHSAGGQLAVALAAHDHRIKHVVSLAGLLDLYKAYELHLSNDAAVEFMGGTPAQVGDHYKEASPSTLNVKAEQLIVHGKKDDSVPYSISADYVRHKSGAERIDFLSLDDADHFQIVDPRTPQWRSIVAAIK
jgi:acetyl esterase/lipase